MSIDTIAGVVRTYGRDRGDIDAIRMGDARVTYRQLDEVSSRVANALAAEGVGPQDRVTFLDKNAIEHFEVQFGASKLNAVSVDVNWRLAPPEIVHIVNDAETKVLIVGQEYVPVLDQIADQLTTVKKIVVVGGHPTHQSYEEWRDAHPATDPGVEAGSDDVCLQLYSSGTTGLPKGVMLTNGNLFALMPQATEIWYFTPESVNLVAMPLFHIGGGGWALVGLYHGCADGAGARARPRRARAHHRRREGDPRLPRACGAAVHAHGAGCAGRRLLEPGDDPLRRVADLGAGAGRLHPDVQVQVRPGLRADRDHGRHRAASPPRTTIPTGPTRTASGRRARPTSVSRSGS